MCGPVAQWIRHLTTNQGIPGSNPGGVDSFSYEENPQKIFAKKSNLWDDLEIINQHVKDSFWFSELRLGQKTAHKHIGNKNRGGFKGRRKGWRKEITVKVKKNIYSQNNQI